MHIWRKNNDNRDKRGGKPEPEELLWIPSNILQLTGKTEAENNLKKRIDSMNGCIPNDDLKWNQNKINVIWKKCEEFYEDYGVQVDPRLLLAIIVEEGTGSFNTSSDNKAGDGGNGPEANFEVDCEKAVDLLGGKIIAYVTFHGAFSKARAEAYDNRRAGIKDYDDILHYLNWETPRLSFISKTFISGVYADDNSWNSGVRKIYSEFAYDDAAAKYTEYVKGLEKDTFEKNARKEGIQVTTDVEFKESKNGRDSQRKLNNEYTIIGVIPDKY